MQTAPAAAPSIRELPKPGGLQMRASETVKKLLSSGNTPKAWADEVDDYLYGQVVAKKESFEKQFGRKATTLTVSVLEGTEAGDPLNPQTQRTVVLGYRALEPLAEQLSEGSKFVIHYKGQRGWARMYSHAVENRDGNNGNW